MAKRIYILFSNARRDGMDNTSSEQKKEGQVCTDPAVMMNEAARTPSLFMGSETLECVGA